MDRAQLKRIRVHIRFLKRYGGISRYRGNGSDDDTVHPFDVDELYLTRQELANLSAGDLDSNGLNFAEVASAIGEIDVLLDIREIG